MKNQNQNFSNKRYRIYFGIKGWEFGVIYDTNTDECYSIDGNYTYYVKTFCIGSRRYDWHKHKDNFHKHKYIEFDSYENFKQSYPELLI